MDGRNHRLFKRSSNTPLLWALALAVFARLIRSYTIAPLLMTICNMVRREWKNMHVQFCVFICYFSVSCFLRGPFATRSANQHRLGMYPKADTQWIVCQMPQL